MIKLHLKNVPGVSRAETFAHACQAANIRMQLESLSQAGCLAEHDVCVPVSKTGLHVVEGQQSIIERRVSPCLTVGQACKRHDLHDAQPEASDSGQSSV